MAETWLTIEKICALTLWSAGHARRASRAWPTRTASGSRARNGKQVREYPLSALSAAAQAKYAEEARKGLAIVRAAEQALPLFASAASQQSPPRIAIPEDLKDQAHARLRAIEPLLDFRKRPEGQRPKIFLAEGKAVSTMDDLAGYIAAQQKPAVSKGTIWRWLDRFDKGGVAALADRPRKDKGQSRFFEEHPAAAAFLQKKFLREGLSREMSWEALCRDWRRIGEKGLTPCYDTARNYLNALPEPLKILGREGQEAHERNCSPFIQRGPVPVMAWWVADHRQFDVLVRNTLFAEKKQDEAYRLWLTAIYDWGSRKIVGFSLAPTPSSRTINSAIRIAVLSHGFPRNFYWDNGKDFEKTRGDLEEITLAEEAKALLDRERIGITSAIPKRPRSKPIESWFARWSKRFDVMWGAAYLGNKPGNRSEAAREAEKQHGKFLAGKRADSPLPTDAEFVAATVQYVEEYNAQARLEALDGRTPNEVMEEHSPEASRQEINPRLLDMLFCERTKRVVQGGGCVQLDGMRYEPMETSLLALDARKGQRVTILRDPYNLGTAVAADAETLQFIGELRIQEFIAQCPNGRFTRDQINAAMRRERGLRRGYADYLALLSAVASNQGWKTEREALVERATARTGTDGSRLLPAAVPGAFGEAPPQKKRFEVGPTFISDGIAEDAEHFRHIDIEGKDDQTAAVPGALRTTDHPATRKPSSPFVSDAVRDFLAKEPDLLVEEEDA